MLYTIFNMIKLVISIFFGYFVDSEIDYVIYLLYLILDLNDIF